MIAAYLMRAETFYLLRTFLNILRKIGPFAFEKLKDCKANNNLLKVLRIT